MDLKIDFNDKKEEWQVYPREDIDIYTSDKFKDRVLESFRENEKDILIDGRDLSYVDSTGLGALIYILKEIKEKGYKLHLTNIKPNILKLLEITELDKVFNMRGDFGGQG